MSAALGLAAALNLVLGPVVSPCALRDMIAVCTKQGLQHVPLDSDAPDHDSKAIACHAATSDRRRAIPTPTPES